MVVGTEMARVLRELSSGPGPGLIGGDPRECARVLGVDGVAVSLAVDGALSELVWCSPGTSERLDDEQFTLGEGPGIDAVGSGALVIEPDLTQVRPDRWPMLLPVLAALGVGSLFCFPLRIGGACVGSLTAQRAAAGPLSDTAMDDALVLAAAVTAVVLDGGGRAVRFSGAEPPTHVHRAVVHQASGMISVQAEVTVAQALMLLRAHAYRFERPLLQVAEGVVTRRLHFRHHGDGPGPSASKGDDGRG
ncbi:ANTAR domain-containing protein [Streptomyces hiroshimensis]|uniref:GAF domain-containing protein n=1 Tax=Streptomyces hiroshimensis TaxID=66424 RepID=A0ABQ2ZDJ9_9ACTN|nr:ANTAR domain-containing protein [Streptomyces hiroshimensis]GGY09386.1 GAF domain-containing protein [Streptomyces hiroshimensis]